MSDLRDCTDPGGFLNVDTNPDIAEYDRFNFSEELTTAMARSGEDHPLDDEFYNAMYAVRSQLFDESDANFGLGSLWDERGDQLQLVMRIRALGLAFAAWASLLGAESNMRLMFALFGLNTFIAGLNIYRALVPAVVG